MRPFRWLGLLCVCAAILVGKQPGSRAEYIGGTRSDIPGTSSGEIRLTDRTFFVFISKQIDVRVPYERINLIEYGQKVSRRYVEAVIISPLLMLSKKRQHFLTVGFQDDDGQQQAMVFRVDKDDIRLALVALEARTGQEVRYQDEEARIAGKG
jgi:hypothetical protein